MQTPATPRFGFHYYPDTLHYRQIDLDTWLPELQAMGASWLALIAPATRAIPESFIAGLLQAGIQPLLHFPFRCQSSGVAGTADSAAGDCPPPETLRLLLGSYARWGVKHVVFFDRPNCRASWPPSAWLQGDLVERFLDLFQPLASLALAEGLTPVLPPLAPGGDYWDLAFLRLALRGLQRRDPRLLDALALSAEAWVGERPLEWGAGGPDKWPGSRPYHPTAAPGSFVEEHGGSYSPTQDHLGLHIFDWYLAACRQEIGRPLPLVLLRMGQRLTGVALNTAPVAGIADPGAGPAITDGGYSAPNPELAADIRHARQNLAIAQMLSADAADSTDAGDAPPAMPPEVIAGCFWLLAAERGQPGEQEAWFPPVGTTLPAAGALRQWIDYVRAPAAGDDEPETSEPAPAVDETPAGEQSNDADLPDPQPEQPVPAPAETPAVEPRPPSSQPKSAPSIAHYVLLPVYAWGAANWDLALIQPILNGAHPTIGFSLAEARLARRVTVVGGAGAISAEALNMLRRSGCQVERLMEDGTVIAS